MKIKLLEKTKNKLVLDISGVNTPFANAARRIGMNEVPVLAIEDVYFEKNNSALYDEIIAQRLGQLPLKFDSDKLNFREECECEGEGCPNCEVVFILEKSGPGTVYSGDLKISNEDVEVLYDNIPILKLGKEHEIKLEATAVLGIGKDHSKWQASISSYKNYPKIKIDRRKLKEGEIEEIIDSCPKNIFKKSSEGKIEIKNPENCDLCKECLKETETEALTVEPDPNRFIFKVESICGLPPEKILNKSMQILENKAEEVVNKIE